MKHVSNEEKIRKWCISHFRNCINVIKDNNEYKEYLSNKVIAWLERQKDICSTCKEWSNGYQKGLKQGERNNIAEQLAAFAQHLNKRGAFRDDLCMDFEHEAQSFIEMQNNEEL